MYLGTGPPHFGLKKKLGIILKFLNKSIPKIWSHLHLNYRGCSIKTKLREQFWKKNWFFQNYVVFITPSSAIQLMDTNTSPLSCFFVDDIIIYFLSLFTFRYHFFASVLSFFYLLYPKTYIKNLHVQLPIPRMLKFILVHSITCAWQVSQAQWLRLYLVFRCASNLSLFLRISPTLISGKHFLSTRTAFFYFGREEGLNKFA